jgi:hypothetical protein
VVSLQFQHVPPSSISSCIFVRGVGQVHSLAVQKPSLEVQSSMAGGGGGGGGGRAHWLSQLEDVYGPAPNS